MSFGLWVYVVMAVVVLVVYATAVYVAWWALFSDRPRGRRRCPRCWHDLSHTPGMTCNECGFTAGRETQFAATRRRWNVAVLAMAFCVAMAGWLYWRLADRSWTAYAPTGLLTAALPFVHDPNGGVMRELGSRAARDQLDSAQWSSLLQRCASGDWWTKPVGDAWQRKYGQLIVAGRTRIDRSDELEWDQKARDHLLDLPPAIELTTRTVWPHGSTPHFHFAMQDWWPLGPPFRITVTPQVPDSAPEVFYRSGRREPWSSLSFEVAGVDPAAGHVTFDVVVERAEDPADAGDGAVAVSLEDIAAGDVKPSWREMARQSVVVPVTFDSSALEALQPLDEVELTEAVWMTFSWGIVRYTDGPGSVRFFYNRGPTQRVDFDGVAVGVHVDLLKGDRIARRLDMWWLAGPNLDNPVSSAVAMEDPELLRQVEETDEWSVRITGDPELALRAGDAASYWAGAFVVPVTLQDRDREAPDLRWWRP